MPVFTLYLSKYLDDDEYRTLQTELQRLRNSEI
jgi:hypothetical protein